MTDRHDSYDSGTKAACETEVAIVGAGFAGLTLAHALAGAGVPVALLDRAPVTDAPSPADGRVFALSAASRRVLETLGLWAPLDAHAQPVARIDTRDGGAPRLVSLDHAETGEGPLGFVVEAARLMALLRETVATSPSIRIVAPAAVEGLDRGPAAAAVTLGGGGALTARLVVGADGRRSAVRRLAGINVTEWAYGQAAVVTVIRHGDPHGAVAEERFLPGGAFAALPMTDAADGAHRSAVIWTEDRQRADDLLTLGDADFTAELSRRLSGRLGPVLGVGAHGAYPLALTMAEQIVTHRLALIGDAAHAIHPVAGQGLNLGIRDVAALAEVIVDARRLGLDIGAKTVLEDFQHWRRFDNTCVAAATDVIHRTFATGFAPVRLARRLGMAALAASRPARRLFMREAMGLTGELPRLVRGRPL